MGEVLYEPWSAVKHHYEINIKFNTKYNSHKIYSRIYDTIKQTVRLIGSMNLWKISNEMGNQISL